MKESNLQSLLTDIDQQKKSLDACRPFPASVLEKLQEALDIEYTFHSNAIEGNTLTLNETMLVLKEGLTISGISLREHLEAVNHKAAIDSIRAMLTKVVPMNQEDIKYIHALVLKGIDNRYAGHYRDVEVMISGAKHMPPPPQEVLGLMNGFSSWLVERQDERDLHPVRLAAQAHLRLVGIHPFIDGNGRTARLLMNLMLLKYGYPYAVIRSDMDYRMRYYQSLDQAHTRQMDEPFEVLVAECVSAMLDKYLGAIPKR